MNELRRRVQALINTGAVIQAITAAADFVRRNPRQPEGFVLLSQTEEIAGYTRAAIKTVAHAIALAPQEPAYRFQRGRLNLTINALSEAIEDLDKVIEMETQQAVAHYTEAAVACRDEALERLQSRRSAATQPIGRRSFI